MPPANATNVTWMLFVKIAVVNAACSPPRHVVPRWPRLGRCAELARHDAERRRRVARAPTARRAQRAPKSSSDREQQRPRPLGDQPPVAGREEAQRSSARRVRAS